MLDVWSNFKGSVHHGCVFFVTRNEVIRLTDVNCTQRNCLNNKNGWCRANGIHIDNVCRSYASTKSLFRTKTAGVQKRGGRYKQNKGCLK